MGRNLWKNSQSKINEAENYCKNDEHLNTSYYNFPSLEKVLCSVTKNTTQHFKFQNVCFAIYSCELIETNRRWNWRLLRCISFHRKSEITQLVSRRLTCLKSKNNPVLNNLSIMSEFIIL